MKNISFLLLFTFLSMVLAAQAPHNFRYQTVVRDNTGELIADKSVGIKISILKNSPTGAVAYSETFHLMTTALGLINLSVGTGSPEYGSIDDIDWGNGTYFMRIDADKDGGSNYEFLGTSQLLSVPYALYAETSGSGGSQSELYWKRNGNNLYYNDGNVGIGTTNPIGKLNIVGTAEEGDERAFIRLKNYATGPRSTVSIALQSFEEKGAAFGYCSSNYSLNDLSDFGVFTTNGRGFALVAYTGDIRFYTNKNPDGSYAEKMRINEKGNVGIGTQSPLNKLSIEGDEEDWPGRIFLSIRNRSTGPKSLSYLKLFSGPGETGTSLGHISTTYTANEQPEDVAGYGILASSGNGLIINATKPDLSPGVIKFFNGQTPGTTFIETMRINEKGNVGIGTSNPKSKLEITDGDVYISNIDRGIIMKSPDGQCWRGTVNNMGMLEFAPVACP